MYHFWILIEDFYVYKSNQEKITNTEIFLRYNHTSYQICNNFPFFYPFGSILVQICKHIEKILIAGDWEIIYLNSTATFVIITDFNLKNCNEFQKTDLLLINNFTSENTSSFPYLNKNSPFKCKKFTSVSYSFIKLKSKLQCLFFLYKLLVFK